MLPIPENLPLLMGNPDAEKVVADIMEQRTSDIDNMVNLSLICSVKLKFKEPVTLKAPRGYKTDSEHTFKRFFISKNGHFCYTHRTNARTGYVLSRVSTIKAYEPILSGKVARCNPEFGDYEAFKKKFDLKYITEDQIKFLWNSTSPQHGGKYNRNDFKCINKRGKEVLRRFLMYYKGINDGGGEGYMHRDASDGYPAYDILKKEYRTCHKTGKDIKISHQTNIPMVFYSSEYPGCLNGTYGIIANNNQYLHLEDD